MVQVAGFRGALVNQTRVDAASVVAMPLTGVKKLLAKQELVRDTHPSVYRYHQRFEQQGSTVTRRTIFVALPLQPWSAAIRPHEQTSSMARQLAARGVAAETAHTEAVLCGYRDTSRAVDRLLSGIEKQQPVLHVTTGDGTVHTMWRESNPEVIASLQALLAATPLHVLDGHGRYEGMLAYRDDLGGDKLPPESSANYGLACLVNIDDPTLELLPRHRVVRDAASSRADVLTAAKPFFAFDRIPGGAESFGKQTAALAQLGADVGFLALFPDDPDAWRLRLLPSVELKGPHKIDAVAIEDVFLTHVMPHAKARSVLEVTTVAKAVGDGGIGLIMRPLALDHVLRASELGELLPFGSTAFRPALARVVTYLIDPTTRDAATT